METQTIAQEIQDNVFLLFKEYILSIDGKMLPGEEGLPEIYIPKSEVVDKMIEFLNRLGEDLANNARIK